MRHLPLVSTLLSAVLGLAVLVHDHGAGATADPGLAVPAQIAAPAPIALTPRATTALPGMPLFGQMAVVPPAGADAATTPGAAGAGAVSEGAELPASSASYTLYGIILTAGDATRQAIVGESDADQRRYRQGEKLPDGAVVRTIRRKDVVLERGGKLEALPLRKDALLEAASTAPGEDPQMAGQAPDEQASSPPPALPPPNTRGTPDPLANIRRAIEARKAAAARGEAQPPMFEPPPIQ